MKILSLCGGGTSGYMTTRLLSKIEEEIGPNYLDKFDMIAGSSTGSIIGASLATGKTAAEVTQLYKDLHKEIFGKRRSFLVGLFLPLFDDKKLIEACEKYLGETKISEANKHLLITSLRLSRPSLRPKFWKSWDNVDKDAKLSDCVIASSSAPVGFPPYKINDVYYYDGGMVANDPSLCAIADAIGEFGAKPELIDVLTFQTDFHYGFDNPEKFKGMLSVANHVSEFCIDAGERKDEYIANRIYGRKVVTYITPWAYFPIDSNDWDSMDAKVEETWTREKEQILAFFKK